MTPSVPARRERSTSVAEALGYAGGVLVVVGVVLIAVRAWDRLGVGGRLAVVIVAAVVAAGAAWRVPVEGGDWGPSTRLRSTLWLVSSAAAAVAGGLVVHDLFDATSTESVTLGGAACGLMVAGTVWRGRHRPVEQALTWVALAVMAAALGTHVQGSGTAGSFAVVIGVIAITLGLLHRTSPSSVAVWCGGFTLLFAVQAVAASWQGVGLSVGTGLAIAMVSLAQLRWPVSDPRHMVALAVPGTMLLVGMIPSVIGYFARESGLVTGFVVWAFAITVLALTEAQGRLRAPVPAAVFSAIFFAVGPAVIAADRRTPGVVFGLVVSTVLVILAIRAGRIRATLVGSVGLLVYIPWTVIVLVPGELAAPLAIVLAGSVVMVLAVLLLRRRSITPADSATSTPSSHEPGDAG